jgi:hypothetical protein
MRYATDLAETLDPREPQLRLRDVKLTHATTPENAMSDRSAAFRHRLDCGRDRTAALRSALGLSGASPTNHQSLLTLYLLQRSLLQAPTGEGGFPE